MLNKFVRAPYPEHPNRCQSIGGAGQCPYLGVQNEDGTYLKYCWRHSANTHINANAKADHRLYLVAKWKDRLARQADHPQVKNLREEIGLLRMLMEEKLESIHDSCDLILQTQSLTTLIREIRETVSSCNKVELSTGQMLDRNQAISFVHDIVQILTNYINDPDILQMISEDMVGAYDKMIGATDAKQV